MAFIYHHFYYFVSNGLCLILTMEENEMKVSIGIRNVTNLRNADDIFQHYLAPRL